MNDKPTANETANRLGRLKAMQARHKQGQTAVTTSPSAATERAPASEDDGFFDSLESGGSQGGPGGQRAAMVQKLRKFLARPEGGIDQQKARMVFQFVRRQASDPDSPRHDMAKKILAAVNNLDPELRRRLMTAAGAPTPGLGAKDPGPTAPRRREGAPANQSPDTASPPRTGEAWFDDLIDKL